MIQSLTQKILESHLVEGVYEPGQEIGICIDQTLTQDATGTMAYLQFEAMGLPRARVPHAVSFVDHNTIQIGFENADDHRYLQTVAAKFGVKYSKAGNGICHQVHLERFGKPGTTLLGSDSHTPTGGGIGQIAIGAGGLDVALAMAGAPFYLTCPQVVRIELAGRLRPWVSAKDVILTVLSIFSTKGNVGRVLEYGGAGVASLSVPERATITNMGAECGVTTSIFPSDDMTRAFLRAQGREGDWVPLVADAQAAYERTLALDLAQVVPLAAAPHSPGNITEVAGLGGLAVDQVCIGSCTNSSYEDLMRVAAVLKGRRIHPDVSCIIAPGSRQVLLMLARNGALADLIAAGVRLEENACGFCIGNSQSPRSGAVSLRTSNRNFLGRSGTKDAQVYLVSPETAVAAALTGRFTDPRELALAYPQIESPTAFLIDDGLVLPPASKPAEVTVHRGPNIGAPPVNTPLPDDIDGLITLKLEDNITTDHIIPAGARMKYRSNIPKYAEFLFELVDPDFFSRAREVQAAGRHNLIVAGLSYGQGSSREHAAICPMHVGVKIILAKSFERIHTANLVNFGIVPLVFQNVADYDRVRQGDRIAVHGLRECIREGRPVMVHNLTRDVVLPAAAALSPRARRILLAGGALAQIQNRPNPSEETSHDH